jgi:hypothetical protein
MRVSAGVELDGLGADPGAKKVVLDLLVDEDLDQDDDCSGGSHLREHDEDREHSGEVRPHDGDELGDDADEQGHGERERAPTILSVTYMNAPLIAASVSLEYRYPPTLRMAVSPAKSTRCCRSGGSLDKSARRTLGPSAAR